ncbi:septation ring formation regulator EzrA [Bacillus massiliigorillae]|uniref:septation ring formation regulator EzrA n=1 Tax=Bacillus massiliigorillae TaxID=1243664 RepID=UPI0003A5CC62|nr:septation ring formation regulator EzrA [Bacillus massiliigorillae]
MEFILGGLVLVLAFFVIGFFFKKKRYKDIDKLEEWKLNVMNRPVLDELSKVKQLNMNGETEEMFEKWRNEWDEIVTVQLPEIEGMLFDAEEFIDKYRFSSSKEVQRKISQELKRIENDIDRIIDELNDLVGSEEKNRVEMKELQENYRVAKKQLLAHRHTYGKAADQIEHQLEEIAESISVYEEVTGKGNYLQAREYVLKCKASMKDILNKMESIPTLLMECMTTLPNQLSELKEGYKEMLEKEYILNHFDFPKTIEEMEKQLASFIERLDKSEVIEVEKEMEEFKDKVSVLYELFEEEVISRQYVNKHREAITEEAAVMKYENDKLMLEISTIQNSYHISDSEMKVHRQLEKKIATITKQCEQLQLKIEQHDLGYSILSESLKEVEQQIEKVKKEQEAFARKLHALRKDELVARDRIKELRQKLIQASKEITQSNMPGVPSEYASFLNEAQQALKDVNEKLEEKPLDMTAVQIFLKKANEIVDEFTDLTRELIEQMLLAEKVIQYANRYRSRYPSVESALQEAENKFRSYEFGEALEEAAAVLEKMEPGSIKNIKVELNID